MVTVKAPSSQQPRVQSKSPSSLLRIALLLFVVAALVVYWNIQTKDDDDITDAAADSNVSSTENAKAKSSSSKQEEEEQEWWTYSKTELQDWLECWDLYEKGRPVHSHEDWVALRNAYRQVVGEEYSSLLPDDSINGFNVEIQAQVSENKGRAVYAAQDIKEGTLVWTSQHQSAQFRSGLEFRKFLLSISVEMACDVLMWAYVHDLGDDENHHKYRISCDLDEGSFINSARYDEAEKDEEGVEANIGCIDEFDDEEIEKHHLSESQDSGCPEKLFALRDIEKGEEILCAYADFALKRGWKKFGL